MPLTYATKAQLAIFLDVAEDTLPAKAQRWLGYASHLVRNATRTAVYDTDATGAPSDTDVTDAFRDAVCAQVSAWIDLGVDPTAGAAAVPPGVASSSGIGGASVSWSTSTQTQAKVDTIDALVPEALAYLQDLDRAVYVWG